MELQRIYPNMEEMKISYVMSLHSTDFVQNYPNLRKLTYVSDQSISSEDYVLDIVEQNPQIESIEAELCPSYEFLEKVSKIPNIKTLKFRIDLTVLDQPGPIYFDNVENLVVKNHEKDLLNFPFVFNKLKSFTFEQYGYYGEVLSINDWLKSIPNSRYLKEFSMPGTEFTTQNLIEYSKRFSNLESLTMYGVDSYDDTFIRFLADTKIESITIKSITTYSLDKIMATNLTTKEMNVSDYNRFASTFSLKQLSV